jgi:hypothetical protein
MLTLLRRCVCIAGVLAAVAATGRSADAVERHVLNARELAAHGISGKRVRHQTPMASVAVEVSVDKAYGLGEFQFAECIVVADALSPEKLEKLDAEITETVRRTRAEKQRNVFLVLGKEIPGTYLAFQFVDSAKAPPLTRRYLIPVSAISRRAQVE